jgi:hypothetical protein
MLGHSRLVGPGRTMPLTNNGRRSFVALGISRSLKMAYLLLFLVPIWIARRHIKETDRSWEKLFSRVERRPNSLGSGVLRLWLFGNAVQLRDPSKVVRIQNVGIELGESWALSGASLLVGLECAIWERKQDLKKSLLRAIGVDQSGRRLGDLQTYMLLDSWRTSGTLESVTLEDYASLNVVSRIPWIWDVFRAAVLEQFGRQAEANLRYRQAFRSVPRWLPESVIVSEKIQMTKAMG